VFCACVVEKELPGPVSSCIHLTVHGCSAVGCPYVLHVGMAIGNGAGIYPCIGSIFEENTMAGGIGDVDGANCGTITSGNTKEAASAVAGIYFGAGNVRSIAVGHAESSIATAVVIIAACYSSYGTVPALVQQYGAPTCIVTGYTTNIKAI
jgi:hypothetical protein